MIHLVFNKKPVNTMVLKFNAPWINLLPNFKHMFLRLSDSI